MSGMNGRPDNGTVSILIGDCAINTRALISNVQDGDNLGAGLNGSTGSQSEAMTQWIYENDAKELQMSERTVRDCCAF